ncbi:threonine--tRNA ligase [Streptomyces sp. NPDC048324]|uniref:threonine--tRNA ligase n=1 Tax=Streptomyces sp. NPDC048324 TaxID=3157205 RepID=UPI003434B783
MNEIDKIRHSLAHLLAMAALEYDPKAQLGIGPVIENGFYYDIKFSEPFSDNTLPQLEKRMRELAKEHLGFKRIPVSALDARGQFEGQPFKLDLINDLEAKGEDITLYSTGDEFIDLCRGGHVENTSEIPANAFKLSHIAGAYWKGSEKNAMLTRIYGLAFETAEQLESYEQRQLEAKQNDHRVLAEKLDLFTISNDVGKGLPLWLPNGAYVRKQLEDFIYRKEDSAGYQYVYTPVLTHKRLYEQSGHLSHYRDDMYSPIEIEGDEYFLRPMNCPHHHQIFKHRPHSYRDLPMRLAESGLVHRFERSGVLTGLIRARCFTQNDAHIYCAQDSLGDELIKILELFDDVYSTFDIKDYWFRLSLPDFENGEKFGDIEDRKTWETATAAARQALETFGAKYVEGGGEAAFYGPKIDVQIRNVNGKEDTIATVQVDFYSAKRFDLSFDDAHGNKARPVIIHRAIMGSFERFFAFITEQYGGKYPTWLSPTQAVVLPVSDKHMDYAKSVEANLRAAGVRVNTDTQGQLGKRIRQSKESKIPYILVVGDKEVDNNDLSVDSRDAGKLGNMTTADLAGRIKKEISSYK